MIVQAAGPGLFNLTLTEGQNESVILKARQVISGVLTDWDPVPKPTAVAMIRLDFNDEAPGAPEFDVLIETPTDDAVDTLTITLSLAREAIDDLPIRGSASPDRRNVDLGFWDCIMTLDSGEPIVLFGGRINKNRTISASPV